MCLRCICVTECESVCVFAVVTALTSAICGGERRLSNGREGAAELLDLIHAQGAAPHRLLMVVDGGGATSTHTHTHTHTHTQKRKSLEENFRCFCNLVLSLVVVSSSEASC